MRIILDGDINTEDNEIKGVEFNSIDDAVFIQVGSECIRVTKEDLSKILRALE